MINIVSYSFIPKHNDVIIIITLLTSSHSYMFGDFNIYFIIEQKITVDDK